MRPVNVKRNRIDTTIEDLDDIDLDRRSSTGSLTGSYDSGAISSDSEGWFDFLKFLQGLLWQNNIPYACRHNPLLIINHS